MFSEDKVIAYIVEKSIKGIRKQLKGYVQQTIDEIDSSKKRLEFLYRDFEDIIKRARNIKADFEALECMLDESKAQKKLMVELRSMYNDFSDRMMDLTILKQELKIKRIKDE